MIKVDYAYIDSEASTINLKFAIKDEEYYENVYLSDIKITNPKTYGTEYNVYYKEYGEGESSEKSDELILKTDDLYYTNSIHSDLFIIEIKTKGNPSDNTPCGKDKSKITLILFDVAHLNKRGIQFIGEFNDNCDMPQGFIDYLLRLKAMKMIAFSGNIALAIEFWNKFFLNKEHEIRKGCGCHRH